MMKHMMQKHIWSDVRGLVSFTTMRTTMQTKCTYYLSVSILPMLYPDSSEHSIKFYAYDGGIPGIKYILDGWEMLLDHHD